MSGPDLAPLESAARRRPEVFYVARRSPVKREQDAAAARRAEVAAERAERDALAAAHASRMGAA